MKKKKEEEIESPPSPPPCLPDGAPPASLEPFSDYIINILFTTCSLPRIPRASRPVVVLSIKMASHLFLLGWRKNDELEAEMHKMRDEMFRVGMKENDIKKWLSVFSKTLSTAMREYVDIFGYYRMNELVKINQTEYQALCTKNSDYAKRILGQRFVSVKFGAKGPCIPNLSDLPRITLPKESRRKGRALWARAFRLIRERRMLRESKIIRTFSMLIASHRLLTRAENSRQGEKFVVFLGGGMAAGKSTIINKLFPHDSSGAVMIAADDFKFKDPVWNALPKATSSMKLAVHRSSTKTAEQLLLSCLANGRSVILDGTLSWEPFVKQTIEMIRDYKNHGYYRVGPGYRVHVNPDTGEKTVTEKYWELDTSRKRRSRDYEPECRVDNACCSNGPYRVDIVGVVCDPAEAVLRGFRRTLATSRGVPVNSQLRSHRLFSTHVMSGTFLPLVDRMAVYDTTRTRDPKPCMVYDKSRSGVLYKSRRHSIDIGRITKLLDIEHKFPGLMILDKMSWNMIENTMTLRDDAESGSKLYPPSSSLGKKEEEKEEDEKDE